MNTPEALARRMEQAEAGISEACVETWAAARPAEGALCEAVAGGKAFFFGPASPLSQAIGVGLQGPVFEEEFERLEAFFLSRNAPVVLSLCPFADSSVLDRLSRRKYRITHFEHTLVRPLLAGDAWFDTEEELLVRPAQAGEETRWSRTVMQGFSEGEPVDENVVTMFSIFFGARTARPYVAEIRHELAGGASLSVQGEVAMLYGDATLPAFRRRGVQTALIAARLRHAAMSGCQFAIACTLPGTGSQRNYERAGFRVAYTKTMLVRDGL